MEEKGILFSVHTKFVSPTCKMTRAMKTLFESEWFIMLCLGVIKRLKHTYQICWWTQVSILVTSQQEGLYSWLSLSAATWKELVCECARLPAASLHTAQPGGENVKFCVCLCIFLKCVLIKRRRYEKQSGECASGVACSIFYTVKLEKDFSFLLVWNRNNSVCLWILL